MRYCSTRSGGDEREGEGKEARNGEGEVESELDAEEDDLWDEQIKEMEMEPPEEFPLMERAVQSTSAVSNGPDGVLHIRMITSTSENPYP